MRKILVIGTIDETYKNVSGQYDRTEIIRDALIDKGYNVKFINMMNWEKKPGTLLVSIIRGYANSDMIIFLASANGTRVLLNLFSILRILRKKKVFQIVIGGQRNFRFVKNSSWYRKEVANISAVFVEVEAMVDDYKKLGINNVYYLPNCKKINIDETIVNKAYIKEPVRFCTYSRITPIKGIAEAIEVVESLNKEQSSKYVTLDIYGTYLNEDKEWFESLMKKTSRAITYKGKIEREHSAHILSQYDLMLFPTQHIGEGVPGGVIDCYEAGLPIITCNTSYMTKVVRDGITGFVYERENLNGLKEAIKRYTEGMHEKEKELLRRNCQDEAKKYDTKFVIDTLSRFLEE